MDQGNKGCCQAVVERNEPCQVSASVKPYLEILKLTNEAWLELDHKVFQAAWVITGHFEPSHFSDVGTYRVASVDEAKACLDPCDIMTSSKLCCTPQLCTETEWQIEDWSKLVPFENVDLMNKRLFCSYSSMLGFRVLCCTELL